MWIIEPAFGQWPALLEDRPESPDQAQYDSIHDLDGEGNDDEDAASQLGPNNGLRTSDETDASGQLNPSSTAECCHQRKNTLQKRMY